MDLGLVLMTSLLLLVLLSSVSSVDNYTLFTFILLRSIYFYLVYDWILFSVVFIYVIVTFILRSIYFYLVYDCEFCFLLCLLMLLLTEFNTFSNKIFYLSSIIDD